MSTPSTFRWLLWLALLLTAPAQAAFTDNGNGTVTDTVTGLMWDQCSWGQTWGAGSGPGNRSCAGTASIHNWAASLNLANTANTGNRRGYTDWRLPNRTELESLVDINKNASPRIDSVAFPNTPSALFWSSTLYLSINPAYARYVNFNDGNTQHSIQTSTYHVRLVRGGQSFGSFDQLNPYTLSYDANSGAGALPATTNQSAGSNVTTSDGAWATRAGYTLAGWNTAADGTGTAVALGGSLTMPAGNTTLYAQWTANTYPLSYDANGGVGIPPTATNHATDNSVTTSDGVWATRAGYTLGGWNTAANGTGTAVALGGSLTMPAAATTLYAQWTANFIGTVWRDNGAGGGGKENGLKAGGETLLNLPGTVLGGEAGYVVILDSTNTVVAIARVCVNFTPSPCALGQSPGDWQATVNADGPFILYVTDTGHLPEPGDEVLSPNAFAPAGFVFTKPNTNNTTVPTVPAGTGILTDIDPATALTLNFGVVSSSCALSTTP